MGMGVYDEKGGNVKMNYCPYVMCPNKNEYGYCKSTACTNPKHNLQIYVSSGTVLRDYSDLAADLKYAQAEVETLKLKYSTLKDCYERFKAIIKSLGCVTCIGYEVEDDDTGKCKKHIISESNAAENLKSYINNLTARAEKAEAERDAAKQLYKCAVELIPHSCETCKYGEAAYHRCYNGGCKDYEKWEPRIFMEGK
jgi:hypothetical protein